jgi:hypothetical protein
MHHVLFIFTDRKWLLQISRLSEIDSYTNLDAIDIIALP